MSVKIPFADGFMTQEEHDELQRQKRANRPKLGGTPERARQQARDHAQAKKDGFVTPTNPDPALSDGFRRTIYEAGQRQGLPAYASPVSLLRAAMEEQKQASKANYDQVTAVTGTQGVKPFVPMTDKQALKKVMFLGGVAADDPNAPQDPVAPIRSLLFDGLLSAANEKIFRDVVGPVDRYVYEPTHHAIATAMVYTNAHSEDSINNAGPIEGIKKSWEDTKHVSPGQAALVNPVTGAVMQPVAELLNDWTGQDTDVDDVGALDPAKQEDRDKLTKYGEDTWGGKLSSGTGDLFVQVFADPLVYVGKGFKAGRLAIMGEQKLTEAARVASISRLDNVPAELAAHAERETQNATMGKLKRLATATTETPLSPEAQRVKFLTENSAQHTLMEHPEVKGSSNPAALAAVYAKAKTTQEVVDVMKVTRGDKATFKALLENRLHVAQALASQRTTLGELTALRATAKEAERGSQQWLDFFGPDGASMDYKQAKKLVADWAKEDSRLAAVVDDGLTGKGVLGFTEGTPGSGFQQEAELEMFRNWRVTRKGEKTFAATRPTMKGEDQGWISHLYQYAPNSLAVQFVRWSGRQAPSGWAKIAGVSDTASLVPEIRAWLNDVPLLGKLADGQARKEAYFQHIVDAHTKGDGSVVEAIKYVERGIIKDYARHVGRTYGLKGKGLKAWIADIELQTNGWQAHRSSKIKELANEKGYFWDADQPKSKRLIKFAQFESQLEGRIPLMDFSLFDNFARNKMGTTSYAAFREAAGSFNRSMQQLWRTATLMRFAYTQRNVAEGLLRSFAIQGAAAWHPESIAYAGQNAPVRAARVAARVTKAQAHSERLMADAIKRDIKAPKAARMAADALDAEKQSLKDFLDPDDLSLYDRMIVSLKSYAEKPLKRAADRNFKGKTSDGEKVTTFGLTNDPINKDTMFSNVSSQEAYDQIQYARFGAHTKANQKKFRILNTNVPNTASNYFHEVAEFANNHLRGSDLYRLRMTGTDQEFLAYLRSAEGRRLREFAVQTGQLEDFTNNKAMLDWFHQGTKTLHQQFNGDAVILDHILQGKTLTEDFLKARLGRVQKKLPDVVGSHLVSEHPTFTPGSIGDMIGRATRQGWRWLGSIPEDKFVRLPYADTVYRRTLGQLISSHDSAYVMEHLPHLRRIAQREAVRAVRSDLYTLERYSNIARAMEVFSPFISARLNTARTWGRIIANDPSVLRRAQQLWQAPQKAGLEDDQGNLDLTDFINALPGIPELPGDYRFKMPKAGLASIVLGEANAVVNQGADSLLGEGQVADNASIIAGMYLPQTGFYLKPVLDAYQTWRMNTGGQGDIEKAIMRYFQPFGPSSRVAGLGDFLGDSITANLPSYVRIASNMFNKIDNGAYAARSAAVQNQMYVEAAQAGKDWKSVTPSMVADRVKALYAWELMSSFGLPTGAKMVSPNQAIVNQIHSWYDQGMSKVDVSKNLSEKFGADYSALMTGSTTLSGIVPRTRAAVKWINEHQDIVAAVAQRNPADLGLLFGGMPELSGPYDPVADRQLQGMVIPGTSDSKFSGKRDFNDVAKEYDKTQGYAAWAQYQNWKDKKFADAKAQFGESMSTTDLPDKESKAELRAWWSKMNQVDAQMRNRISGDFTGWSEETKYYQENKQTPQAAVKILTNIAKAPEFTSIRNQSPVYWDATLTYLEVRKRAQKELDAAGIPEAGKNKYPTDEQTQKLDEVRAKVANIVDQLKAKSVAFDDMYSRWFRNDEYNSRYWN